MVDCWHMEYTFLIVCYYRTGGKGGLNQHIFKVVPKEGYPKEYVYHRLMLPPAAVLQQFHTHITATLETIVRCNKQNRELSQLRDWLLPMLMNGQAKMKG